MGEVSKAVGQWIVANVGWSVLILLFILSSIFKIAKKEIDPLGWVLGKIGKAFTKDVRDDIAKLKTDTETHFEKVKQDRNDKIKELKEDYNKQIAELRADLDGFEATSNASILSIKNGTHDNCQLLKDRLDAMERSNDMQTIRQIKAHVLDFANSCMNGRKHTFRDFRNIIKENKQYEDLVSKYGLENDVYKDDYDFIMEIYHDCKKNRSFLNDEGKEFSEADEAS